MHSYVEQILRKANPLGIAKITFGPIGNYISTSNLLNYSAIFKTFFFLTSVLIRLTYIYHNNVSMVQNDKNRSNAILTSFFIGFVNLLFLIVDLSNF